MKRYFQHMQSKDPHERRTHAMRVAGSITAFVFVVWITTLGYRLSTPNTDGQSASSQAASVFMGNASTGNGLEVASTTFLNY